MKTEPVDYRGYPVKPRKIDELSWFYEEPKGLCVINEPIEGARSTMIRIPWRKIAAAVDRHRRLQAKHRKR